MLQVDDEHSQLTADADAQVPHYRLMPASRISVDARKYAFKMPFNLSANRLNSLQLVQANDRQYSIAWNPGQNVATISATSARPNPGSKPFAGFVTGDSVIIAIGVLDGPAFKPAWVGLVDVK